MRRRYLIDAFGFSDDSTEHPVVDLVVLPYPIAQSARLFIIVGFSIVDYFNSKCYLGA